MDVREFLKENIVYLDGGMGTLLQKKGLMPGEYPEKWNVTNSDIIVDIHKAYFDAGSNIVCTNTFGANLLKFSHDELDLIIKSAVNNARKASELSLSGQNKWVALDIGPSGKMLAPYGDFDFEEAVALFAETVKLGVKYGVDLIMIETMSDSYETKSALLAVKENCDLPVFVSNAYGEDGKLMTGASPSAMVALLEGMGADAIGVNCSFGPKKLTTVVKEYLKYASVPVILKPNAGLPKIVNGESVYDVLPEEFADDVSALINGGVSVVGGCCGTTPEYIAELHSRKVKKLPVVEKNHTVVSSYTHAVEFGNNPVLIGERINPTGKKRFKEALRAGDIEYILKEGISQQEMSVHALDVNVGLPEIDEIQMLKTAVCRLQEVVDLPLQIDTSNAKAMELALRRYNGKALINSVNGKQESMNEIFPLVKKYGGVVIALTLDEKGIPATAEGRLEIAKNILDNAKKWGIAKKNIIFDPLALSISADASAGKETLKAVKLISENLSCATSLGVSNVSFGLPERDVINGIFFSLALENGLSAAIINPYSTEVMRAYFAYVALSGKDENCSKYIEFAQKLQKTASTMSVEVKKVQTDDENKSNLQRAIIKGLKEQSAFFTKELLKNTLPLDIVQEEIIPALNTVGVGFENKTVFLPQLLMSAESAKCAFEVIKTAFSSDKTSDKCAFVIATVKGDIHDIGKNIVKLLLENFGFIVTDLGKDVSPELIVETVIKLRAPLVGLSALMTTTVPAMEHTIKLLRINAPWCKIVVGGAVLTQEYADMIGADKYAKDAMETVRYAEKINDTLSK